MDPILVTGAARSGTSLVAGTLHICGAWGGEMRGPNRFNQKGMFENKEIVRNLVKPFLKEMGFDPMGQNPLPDIVVFHKAKEEPLLVHKEKPYTLGQLAEVWRKEIFSAVAKQGYQEGPWFYKGAKICLFWPLWAEAFPEAQWIIVRRHPEDIVRSCFKTAFMRGYRSRSGWLRWVAEHEKRFEEMADAKLKIYEVWPQRAINGDLIELQMVVNDLGLEWKADEVAKFITPSLWLRSRSNEAVKR